MRMEEIITMRIMINVDGNGVDILFLLIFNP